MALRMWVEQCLATRDCVLNSYSVVNMRRSSVLLIVTTIVICLLLWTVSRRSNLEKRRQEVLTRFPVHKTSMVTPQSLKNLHASTNPRVPRTKLFTPPKPSDLSEGEKQEPKTEETIKETPRENGDAIEKTSAEKSEKTIETMPRNGSAVERPNGGAVERTSSSKEPKKTKETLQTNVEMIRTTSSKKSTEQRAGSTCHSNAEKKQQSSWFASKVNTNVPMFLNRVNNTLSAKTKRWWLANMAQADNGLDRIIANLLKVVPGRSSFRVDGKTCISCAIVGNAGNLRGSNYGTLIDSQDVVIRANTSPTKGYENDVGKRTTHQIIYPESAVDYHPSAVIIFLPFKQNDFRWLTSIYTTKDFNRGFWKFVPKSLPNTVPEDTYIIHPEFLHYVENTWLTGSGRKWPSAGMISLILGLHLCDEVHVMGFGVNNRGLWDHYYEREVHIAPLKVSALNHPVGLEENIRNKLKVDNIITLYPGNMM